MQCPDTIAQCVEMASAPVTIAWVHAVAAVVLPLGLYAIRSVEEKNRASAQREATAKMLLSRLKFIGRAAAIFVTEKYELEAGQVESAMIIGLYEIPRFDIPHHADIPPDLVADVAALASAVELYAFSEKTCRRMAEARRRGEGSSGQIRTLKNVKAVMWDRGIELSRSSREILEMIGDLYPSLKKDADEAAGEMRLPDPAVDPEMGS